MFVEPFTNFQSSVININCCAFLQCNEVGFNCVAWPLESFANIKCKQSKFYFVCNHHYSRFNSLFSSIHQRIISKPTIVTIEPKNNPPIEKKKRGPKKGSKRKSHILIENTLEKVEKQEKTKVNLRSFEREEKKNIQEQKNIERKTHQTRGKLSKEIEELDDLNSKFSFEILCEEACKMFDVEFDK